jgi:SNF family Na+-dependent transporter
MVYILTTCCLINGIKSSGKAVYVTALLPYVCLLVLIGQSLFLDGSYEGLKYYLTPRFDKLFELKVWLAAAIQIFFSLGPGFGVLITYSSYTSKSTNIKKLTIMCSIVNCVTSLLYGVVVFAGLGYMAKRLNKDINYFLRDGIGLVFAVYPEIIATFKGAYIYAIVFFVMLITLGMDSAFGK